jgi:hypothetical protein
VKAAAWGAGRWCGVGVGTTVALANAMTAQIAQSWVGCPSGSRSEEVLNRARPEGLAREALSTAAKCAAAKSAAAWSPDCCAFADAVAAPAAAPWKCPNDSRNWIASPNSASRDPCLMFDRNHFMPRCASSARSGRPSEPMRCYSITSPGSMMAVNGIRFDLDHIRGASISYHALQRTQRASARRIFE